ncbi:MAG: hypothetical protein ABW224_07265, partial [Kibdelosporangium sp.]
LLTAGDQDVSPVEPLAATPQVAPVEPVVATGTERVAAHVQSQAPVTESPRQLPGAHQEQHIPTLPRLPLPMPSAPPAVPAGACASCGTGSAHDAFGIRAGQTRPNPAAGFATSRALRLDSQHVALAAGEQPGVTPD